MSPPRLGSRTVHESWPLTRLLSHVAFVTRTWTVSVSHGLASMTVAVKQLEVVVPISPATALGDDMIDFHPITLREEQATLWALSVLSFQESGDAWRDFRMLPETCTPIHPIPIIGTARAMDLHVQSNRRLSVSV